MAKLETLDTPESFEIKVPIRKYWIPMFLFGSVTIFLGLIIYVIIAIIFDGIVNEFPFPNEVYFHFLLFPIFLNLAMWFIFGYEKIIFTNNRLEIIKSNRIFSRKKVLNLCEINSVEIRKDNPNILEGVHYISEMRRAMFFWRKMGRIILKTKNSKLTILNGLPKNEVVKMKILIKKEIEQRCS